MTVFLAGTYTCILSIFILKVNGRKLFYYYSDQKATLYGHHLITYVKKSYMYNVHQGLSNGLYKVEGQMTHC